jgi:hypothetical protein
MSEPPNDRFRLHALGAPDLRAPDGHRIGSVLSQPKRVALLTYLAVAPAPVARATVVETFWPDSDDARARNALSQALFHLRRALGEDVVESVEGDRLWISPERLWCDARALLAQGTSANHSADDPADVAGAAGGGGELLEGWNAEEPPLQAWLDEQRRRIRERIVASTTPTTPTRSEPAPSRWKPRIFVHSSLAVVAVAALVPLVVTRLGGRPSVEDLAVLLPRVTVATGAVDVSAQAIFEEVLAHLPTRDDLRVIPAPSAASVPAFRTQLATIGAPLEQAPDWILEVSVRVSEDEVAVVGLLYRTPAFDIPGRERFGLTVDQTHGALLDAPREIALGVAAMVERVLAGRPR